MRRTVLILSASLLFPAFVFAGSLTNAFVVASGDGLRFVDGRDFAVTGAVGAADVSLAPNPGWRLLTPPEISVSPGGAVAYRVRSLLGEDEGDGAVTNEVPEAALHLEPPTISALIDADVPYVYTQPQTEMSNIVFRLDGVCDTPGIHGIEGQEPYDHLSPTHWTWEWSFGEDTGVVHGASADVGPFVRTKGTYDFTTTLTASNSACPECAVSTNLVRQIVVSELILSGNPWIGQDRTGDPDEPQDYPMFSYSADLDPANPDVDHIEMDYDGVCDTRVNYGTEIHAWCTNRELSSVSYTNEVFTAIAIPKTNSAPSRLRRKSAGRGGMLRDANGGGAPPAQANRRGTVQKVDVTIGNWISKKVEEAGEESVGTYVLYRNGTPTSTDIPDMTPVTFSCAPDDLPPNAPIRITHSGRGTLYMKMAGSDVLTPATPYPAYVSDLEGKEFYLHGSTVSGDVADSSIRIEHPESGAVDEARYTVLQLSLDMTDLFHAEAIPSEEKQNPGAFIHWNIDNDDESLSLVVPKHFGGDYLQTNESVENEDDLVPLKITIKPVPLGGEVSLSCGNGVALWRSPIKGQQNARFMAPGQTRSWPLQTAVSQETLSTMLALPFFAEGVLDVPTEVCISYANPYTQTPVSDSITITPIAANCGNQPKLSEVQKLKDDGNSLVGCEWSVTGESNIYYNCIAWVVNKTDRVYEKAIVNQYGIPIPGYIDGNGIHRFSIDYFSDIPDGFWSIDDFDSFMKKELSFVPADTISAAEVIYYSGFHAAKRKGCSCGSPQWRMFESKMGSYIRIEHLPEQLTEYGTPFRFYRPVASTTELIAILETQ